MPSVVVKLGPCDGTATSWWRPKPRPCGRPSGHHGRCRVRARLGDVFALRSGPHEVRTTCHRCGTLVIARAREQAEASGKLHRWLYGHLIGMPCRETLLDVHMRGVLAPTVLLDVDGTQHTYGGRGGACVPDAPLTEQR